MSNLSGSQEGGLRSHDWLLSYRTSSTIIDGRPVDMLHDFYIPALRLSVGYDRVAGYFRSSSLAAASLGFSAFVGKKGLMRLVVGADLEVEDVRAILHGDSERLERQLSHELEGAESWPESVRDGVTLLGWMVANGYLEVRVAFRVHGDTGEPISYESVEDGYVHEKWFVLKDEYGNRLYGSGTLNESKTAFMLNAENVDIHCDWHGQRDRRRVDDAAFAFEDLWEGRVPHVPVLTLPDAVKKRLIVLTEGVSRPTEVDGTSEAKPIAEPPSAMERLRCAVIRDAPRMPGGRFVGLYTAPVEPWPHQEVVVRRLVQTWPYSYLLCDEVGLGKTIEAGLAFRCLNLSGMAKRILVAPPAGLAKQWHREMQSKVLMRFGRVLTGATTRHEYLAPVHEECPASSPFDPDLVIVSTGVMVRADRQKALRSARPYDLALVDEAHALRRRNPVASTVAHPDYGVLYTVVRDLLKRKSKSLWLATATPMQIDPIEVCDLLALTGRIGAFQHDPGLTLGYYRVLQRLVQGGQPLADEWAFVRESVGSIRKQDPLYWNLLEEYLIDGRIRHSTHQWIVHGQTPIRSDRRDMLRLIFAAAPLSRTMMRHTRALLEIYHEKGQLGGNLARRTVLGLPEIRFSDLENEVYRGLEEYCKGLGEQISQASTDIQTRHALGFFKSFLRLRFASSFYALHQTLIRRLKKIQATIDFGVLQDQDTEDEPAAYFLTDMVVGQEDEDDERETSALLKGRTFKDLEWEKSEVESMIALLERLPDRSSKMVSFLKALDQRREAASSRFRQTVVFTRFYDTLVDIVRQLLWLNPTISIASYSGRGGAIYDKVAGEMVQIDRDRVKEGFLRGEIDVLICTDAAAEGLNLQTADLLINFDLGWNPMKVEQRIGRIDRIGQKHSNLTVLNLCYYGSAEEIVYGRLLARLQQANIIVGTQQVSLLPVTEDDFAALADGTLSPEELEERAQERLVEQQGRVATMEIPPQDLYDMYVREAKSRQSEPIPIRLEDISAAISESEYLQNLGCTVSVSEGSPIVRLRGIEGVQDGTILTTSRSLYESGLREPGRVHFASYGDPCFEAVLSQIGRFEMPPCIRRVSVPIPEMDAEMVCYGVVCRTPGGQRQVKSIQGWRDLDRLDLAIDDSITEEDLNGIRWALTVKVAQETLPYLTAGQIEDANNQAALAQQVLTVSIAAGLLRKEADQIGDTALFWPNAKQLEERIENGETPLIVLDSQTLKPAEKHLLFAVRIPIMSDTVSYTPPAVLAKAAIHHAFRLADGMRERKSELTLGTMISRLLQEARATARKMDWAHGGAS